MNRARRLLYRIWNRLDLLLTRFQRPDSSSFFATSPLVPIRVTYEEFRDGEWRNIGDMEYDPTERDAS